jgi:multidrug resistance efflux pump
MKKKIVSIAIKFFLLIIVFTIISRGAYNMTTIRVVVSQPKEMNITHDLFGSGEVCAKDVSAVVVKEGIAIKSVNVAVGDFVKKGTTLFSLSRDSLKNVMAKLQDEIKILDLQTQAAKKSMEETAKANPDSVITDTTVQQNAIMRRQKTDELLEYQKLKNKSEKITAGSDGFITAVNINPGDITTGTAAVLLSNAASELYVSAKFNSNDAAWILKGTPVTIPLGGHDSKDDLKINSVYVDNSNPSEISVSIDISDEDVSLGRKVDVIIHAPSKDYVTCVPRDALHQSDNSAYYINTISETDTVLGKELHAVRQEISLLDANDEYAAIDGVSLNQSIIIYSTGMLTEDSKVKIMDEERSFPE